MFLQRKVFLGGSMCSFGKVKVSKMYGLNECDDFILDIKNKNNIIYGYNAVGKSSVSKAFYNVIFKNEYKPLLLEDSRNFNFELEFDDIKIKYDENIPISDLPNIQNKIYVFDKFFARNNISDDGNVSNFIQVGIRLNEKKKILEDKSNKLDGYRKVIKESLKSIGTAMKDFKDDSILSSVLKTSNVEENTEKIIKYFNDSKIDDNDYGFINEDFLDFNLKKYNNFKNLISVINKDLIESLKEYMTEKDYNIKDIDDLTFYQNVISYFTNKNNITKCPICLNEKDFNYEEISNKISELIKNYLSERRIKEINDFYMHNIDGSSSKSIIIINIRNIIENIFNGKYLGELINTTIELIDILNNRYDELLFKYIKLDIDDFKSKFIILKKDDEIIREIDKLNEKLNDNKFINTFEEMLILLFDKKFQVKAKFADSYINLELGINGKSTKNIKSFYEDILSESQKTKISLAFFFSIIIYQNGTSNEKILCLFDDPVDSYDSMSKYELARIIFEFNNNKKKFKQYNYDCYSIILTHSTEFLRLCNENSTKEIKFDYYIFTKNGVSLLNNEKLYVFSGDYTILQKIICNSGNSVHLYQMLSITPILRELSVHSYKVFKNNELGLNLDEINKLNKYLSNNIIHGLFRSELKVEDYINEISKYNSISIDISGIDLNEKLADAFIDYIKDKKSEKLEFFDEIILKNIISIYIRAMFDHILVNIIKKSVLKYRDSSFTKIHDDNFSIGNKVVLIENNYPILSEYIQHYLSMFNDFGHSANNYLTPLIDVKIENLYKILDEFYCFELDDGTIVSNYF